jgi:hypothetical protein
MFGLKDHERQLYERLLEEKERLVVTLASEVDWHRAQTGTYLPTPASAPVGMVPVEYVDEERAAMEQLLANLDPGELGGPQHMSEDEEEIRWQMENGAIDFETAAAAIRLSRGATSPFDEE